MVDTISGVARLDRETIQADNFFIQDRNNKSIPASKFIDQNRKCELIIGISKAYKTSTIAKIFEKCENNITTLTPILYYK